MARGHRCWTGSPVRDAKTLSNYTNHLAATPLDEQFAAAAWEHEPAGTGA